MNPDPTTIAPDDCEALDRHLSAYVDGELPGAERATVERHLADCARCRATADAYRGWGPALRAAMGAEAARDLSAIAWPPGRPADRPSPLTRRRRLFYDVARWSHPWPVLAGAAALVALIIGVGWWNPATIPERRVEIDRIDADGPVMVFTANEGRTAIIWLSEPDQRLDPEPTPI